MLVAAAADLAPTSSALSDSFLRLSSIPVRFSLGSSGLLAQQIRNGAPFDIYLSANEGFVRDLAASGHIREETVRAYATGRVGLWSATGKIKDLKDLEDSSIRHIAIPNPRHAPYGVAAEEVLRRSGLLERLQPKIVYGENVRQALEFAQSGNADAVLTAWTLLQDKGGLLLPDRLHNPIRQTGGMVSSSKNEARARKFLDFLTSPAGQEIFRKHGFAPPPG